MLPQLDRFRIERGIGQFASSDYYAILGLPVTAGTELIRRRYLQLAKNLHPDVFGLAPEDKDRASQYFSRLVGPAYSILMQDRERSEYSTLLKLIAKRLMKRELKVAPTSEPAQKLLRAPTELNYQRSISAIAEVQYSSLDKVIEYINQLSELNLVYVLSQEGYKLTPQTNASSVISYNSSNSGQASYTEPLHNNVSKSTKSSGTAQSHIRLAEGYIAQKQWSFALKELRTALQLDQSSAKCHALLGLVYMNQKLVGMSKVSFQQALKINPNEPIALQNIGKVSNASGQKDDHKKGGFFGWLG